MRHVFRRPQIDAGPSAFAVGMLRDIEKKKGRAPHEMSFAQKVTAHIVMAYKVMVCIVMALYSYGLYSYGPI